SGAAGLVGSPRGDPRGDVIHGCVLEGSGLRLGERLHGAAGQCPTHDEGPRAQDRRFGLRLDRTAFGARGLLRRNCSPSSLGENAQEDSRAAAPCGAVSGVTTGFWLVASWLTWTTSTRRSRNAATRSRSCCTLSRRSRVRLPS